MPALDGAPRPLAVLFAGGERGAWRIERLAAVRGAPLPVASRLEMVEGAGARPSGEDPLDAAFVLRGVTGSERYTTAAERAALLAAQPPLGRPEATRAALIPITKSAAWWALAQDERRAIFEERSHHIALGLTALPAVARRLHHCRELGEPFDFLTWFEYAPADAGAFERLVERLRATPEWTYVDRELDVRLVHDGAAAGV